MIIELYGLTGSGKTYLSKKLEESGFFCIKFDSKVSKYLTSLSFIFSHPILSAFLLSKINRFSNRSTKLLPIKKRLKLLLVRSILLLATMSSYKKALRYRGAVILDEGFFQIIHSIFEDEIEEEIIKNLIDKIPKPEILVIVDSTKKSREERFNQKGYPRRDEFGSKYFFDWYKVMESNDLKIRKILSNNNYNILIHEFDIPKSYSKALNKLISLINKKGKND